MDTKGLTRREFLRGAALTSVGLVAAACAPTPAPTEAPVKEPVEAPAEEAEEAPTEVPVEEAPTEMPAVIPTKEKIVFGGARPLSGPSTIYEETAFGPIYKMWIEEVNAKGGIYVEEYGKQLPIAEPIIYDDKSDLGTMTRLVEKLIVEDQVDFVLPPASTAFLFAAAPIFNKYEYILLGAEGGATTITDLLPTLPYFFGVLNYSDHNQMPVLADIFEELGVESVGIMFIQDLHGIEYSGVAVTEMGARDIDVKLVKSVPFDVQDVSSILKEAEAANVDAFLSCAYPQQNFLAIGQAMALGYNPKAFLTGPGACFSVCRDSFGPAAEGIMGYGAWNCKSSDAAAEFCDKFIARYGGDEIMDWWGHLPYYGGLQFLEQAIEKAGTLDQSVIRDVMATETFDTVLGPTWFESVGGGGCLLAVDCYAGQIGQWQSGVFEVIDTGEKRTADPIYPKPPWPAPAEG
jgi:branched-chain amino acid transport system substrate-binding protein